MNKRAATRLAKQRLDEVGIRIADFDVSVRRLSGGQRQAIAIARAMMKANKLMMLDEPTAALGVHQTHTTLEVIRSVAKRGIGVIVISHSIDDVFAVADRIVVLRLGRVVLDTPASETTTEHIVGHITGGLMGTRAMSDPPARRRSAGPRVAAPLQPERLSFVGRLVRGQTQAAAS